MIKIILAKFFRGMGNSMFLMLPYYIKNPYKDSGESLTSDWYYCSWDIRNAYNKLEKEHVSKSK